MYIHICIYIIHMCLSIRRYSWIKFRYVKECSEWTIRSHKIRVWRIIRSTVDTFISIYELDLQLLGQIRTHFKQYLGRSLSFLTKLMLWKMFFLFIDFLFAIPFTYHQNDISRLMTTSRNSGMFRKMRQTKILPKRSAHWVTKERKIERILRAFHHKEERATAWIRQSSVRTKPLKKKDMTFWKRKSPACTDRSTRSFWLWSN